MDELSENEEENDERKFNLGFMTWLVSVTVVGGFLFGYDFSIIGVAQMYFYADWPEITTGEIAVIVSIAMVGAAIGASVSGPLSDRYGRRPMILVAAFTYALGASIIAVAPSVSILIIGRFIIGLSLGALDLVI